MIKLPKWAKKAIAIGAIGLASYLPMAYAENAPSASKTEYIADADGVMASNYISTLSRYSNNNLISSVQRASNETRGGDYAMPAIPMLNELIKYWKENPQAPGNEAFKQIRIDFYEGLKNKVIEYEKAHGISENSQAYEKSVKSLDSAVSDGIVYPKETECVEGGYYGVVEYGKKKVLVYDNNIFSKGWNLIKEIVGAGKSKPKVVYKDYSVPRLEYLAPEKKKEKPEAYKPKTTPYQAPKQQSQNAPEKSPSAPKAAPSENTSNYVPPQAPAKKEDSVRLVAGAGYSGYQNTAYGTLGARFGSDNDLVNASVTGNIGKGCSGNTYTTTGPTSPAGLYGVGTINQSDYMLFGVDGNLYIGKEVKGELGGGIEFIPYMETQTASVMNGSKTLSSNSSAPQGGLDILLRGSAGIDFSVGSNSRGEFDFTLDYSLDKKKPYAGFEGKFTF